MYEIILFWTKYESNIFLFLRELFKQKISLTVYWRYSYPTFLYNICDNFVRFADLTYIYIYRYSYKSYACGSIMPDFQRLTMVQIIHIAVRFRKIC